MSISSKDEELRQAVESVIGSLNRGLLNPRLVEDFERQIAHYIGTKYAIVTSSCTSAIYLVLKTLGIGHNDEIIVPDCTFPATVNPIEHIGAKPVFVDVDSRTGNIDPNEIEASITTNTKAIMPVHQFGLSADLGPIIDIARRSNLYVIEDAACAFGAEYNSSKCGSFGIAGCFSFNPMKIITTGMGGAITTNSEGLFEECRALRGYGDVHKEFINAGYNVGMHELNAYLGLIQMERIEEHIERRRYLANVLISGLAAIDELILPFEPPNHSHVYQCFPIRLSDPKVRHDFRDYLRRAGVSTYIGSRAIHSEPYYRKKYGRTAEFPISTNIANGIVCLHWSPFLECEYIEKVVAAAKQYFKL